MKITYVANTRIFISAEVFYVERGDILSFAPANRILTIYRAQRIVKTVPFTQSSLNAMVRTGMIQVFTPPLVSSPVVASLPPVVPPSVPETPAAPSESVPVVITDSVTMVPEPAPEPDEPVVEPSPEPIQEPEPTLVLPEPESEVKIELEPKAKRRKIKQEQKTIEQEAEIQSVDSGISG